MSWWTNFSLWRSRVAGRKAISAMHNFEYQEVGFYMAKAKRWEKRSMPNTEAMERALLHPTQESSAQVHRGHDAHFTTAYADGARDAQDRPDRVTLESDAVWEKRKNKIR